MVKFFHTFICVNIHFLNGPFLTFVQFLKFLEL